MAENPLATLARVLGGVVLMDGRLGHQVLGQLLVMNTNEVAIAGASVVVAGTSGQRSAVGQAVVRTVIPALAVRALLQRAEKRIDRKAQLVSDREDEVDRREWELAMEERELERLRHAAMAERTHGAARAVPVAVPIVVPAPPSVSPAGAPPPAAPPLTSPPVGLPPAAPPRALLPAPPAPPSAAAPKRPKKRARPRAAAPPSTTSTPAKAKPKAGRAKPPAKPRPRGRR